MKNLNSSIIGLALALFAAALFSVSATAETFSDWLARHNVPVDQQGTGDDPAGDGIANIVKYALDLNPLQPSRDQLPKPEFFEGNRVGIVIPKNPQSVGVEITVEASSDLLAWSNEEVEIVSESAETLTAVDTVSTEAGARRFLRVLIPPPVLSDPPDAYLYVVGGRVLAGDAENVDPELDGLYQGEATGANVRGILVADIDLEGRTVGNWRRAGILPTDHPELVDGEGQPEPLFWLYIHENTHVYNGRLYAGTTGSAGGGVEADFVAWADIDLATGQLGEFSISDRVPGPETTQRIGASAIAEIDGVAYYYILGGSSDAGQTDRILYATIDAESGALGEWQVSSTGLPTTDWFNAAMCHEGKILHASGHGRTTGTPAAVDVVTPDSGGNITASWSSNTYDWNQAPRRWDHIMLKAEVGSETFVYLAGGVNENIGVLDTVHFSRLVNGVPEHEFTEWPLTNPMPGIRRRFAAAAVADMLIVPGGSTTTSAADATNTLFIGVAGSDGEVTWTESEEPLFQARSFHGAAIAPVGSN